jgi:hypothetical protein
MLHGTDIASIARASTPPMIRAGHTPITLAALCARGCELGEKVGHEPVENRPDLRWELLGSGMGVRQAHPVGLGL